MLVVETIAKIRRASFVESKSIKQICRDLKLSRNMVRKVIQSGNTAFSYDRSVQPRPKIDPWKDQLDRLLEDNAGKPKRELPKTRLHLPSRNSPHFKETFEPQVRRQLESVGRHPACNDTAPRGDFCIRSF